MAEKTSWWQVGDSAYGGKRCDRRDQRVNINYLPSSFLHLFDVISILGRGEVIALHDASAEGGLIRLLVQRSHLFGKE